MSNPTRADLAAAVKALTEENAGLRDLLAAVSEYARSVPQHAASEPDHKELRRARRTLIRLAVMTDPDDTWTWGWASGQAAARLREHAAEPVGYEVYAEPVIAATAAAAEPCGSLAPHSSRTCKQDKGHDGLCRDAELVWEPPAAVPERENAASVAR